MSNITSLSLVSVAFYCGNPVAPVLAVFGPETCVQDNRRLSRGERLVVLPRPSVFEDLIAFLIYTLQLFTRITIVVRYGPTNYASASMRQKEFQLAAQKMQ